MERDRHTKKRQTNTDRDMEADRDRVVYRDS